MPHHPRASDIATEAKRHYVPYINGYIQQNQEGGRCWTTGSYLFPDSSVVDLSNRQRSSAWPSVAVVEGDAVDIALDWQETEFCEGRCPVVNMANPNKAGGDWETVTMGPEEGFARRSNLASALKTEVGHFSAKASHYPIPPTGGIYSPCVVVFRNGPDDYQGWGAFRDLPVISVAPVRRPKLDKSGSNYAFKEERELMRERMQTILRIAGYYGHQDLCLGSFGIGPLFRNPTRQAAELWRELLFQDPEFHGLFKHIIFAFDTKRRKAGTDGSREDFDIFNEVFDPRRFSKYR